MTVQRAFSRRTPVESSRSAMAGQCSSSLRPCRLRLELIMRTHALPLCFAEYSRMHGRWRRCACRRLGHWGTPVHSLHHYEQ